MTWLDIYTQQIVSFVCVFLHNTPTQFIHILTNIYFYITYMHFFYKKNWLLPHLLNTIFNNLRHIKLTCCLSSCSWRFSVWWTSFLTPAFWNCYWHTEFRFCYSINFSPNFKKIIQNKKKLDSPTRVTSSIFLSSSSNSISLLLLLSSSSLSELKCSSRSTSCAANFCSSSSLSLFSNSFHSRLNCNSISVNVSRSLTSKNRVKVQFGEYKEVNKQSTKPLKIFVQI